VPQQPPFLLPHRHSLLRLHRVLQQHQSRELQRRSLQLLQQADKQRPLLLAHRPSVLHLPRYFLLVPFILTRPLDRSPLVDFGPFSGYTIGVICLVAAPFSAAAKAGRQLP